MKETHIQTILLVLILLLCFHLFLKFGIRIDLTEDKFNVTHDL